jgi:hypothetical protein
MPNEEPGRERYHPWYLRGSSTTIGLDWIVRSENSVLPRPSLSEARRSDVLFPQVMPHGTHGPPCVVHCSTSSLKDTCAIKNFFNSNTGLIHSYIDDKGRKVLVSLECVSLECALHDNVRLKTMCAVYLTQLGIAQFHSLQLPSSCRCAFFAS